MNKERGVSFIAGLVFSLGLGLSGMTNPQNIIDFLNVLGDWSPALLFVMGGAVSVTLVSYFATRKKYRPLCAQQWDRPTNKAINSPLFVGAALFGLGWGLAGYCPAPAFVSLVSLQGSVWIFVLAMIAGMFLFSRVQECRSERRK